MLAPFILSAFVALAPQAAVPAKPLPKASVEALQLLLQDERRAEALYAAVIQEHGEVRPFSNIIEAERRHQNALEGLFEAHGLPVPPNPWKDKKAEFSGTFNAACQAGIRAEEENVALYDRLMKTVQEPDLLEVFERLRWASQERHLPAFRRHLDR
jgi:hypothetical protein